MGFGVEKRYLVFIRFKNLEERHEAMVATDAIEMDIS